MSTIKQSQRKMGFEFSLKFYRNEIGFSDAVEQLSRSGISRGSASDYVRYITEYMNPSKTPTRTMSTATQTFFMEGVLKHLGYEALLQWETNDLKHFDYYEGVSGAKVVKRRKNLKLFMDKYSKKEVMSKKREDKNYWVITSNPEEYDSIKAFENLLEVDWGNANNNKINVGDIVYIY